MTALSDALVHVVVAPECALATAVHAVQHAVASAETLMSHGEPAHVPVAPDVANSPPVPPAAAPSGAAWAPWDAGWRFGGRTIQ